MSEVRNFVAVLAMARKCMQETKILNEQAYSNKSLKKKQIYQIIIKVKEGKSTVVQWNSHPKKTKPTEDVIADFSTAI
jgi:hypothetical protein